MRQPIQIACAARRDYVPHAATMLHSVLERAGAPVAVTLLHGSDMRRGDASRLAEMVRRHGGELSALEVSADRVAGLRTLDFLPASHWYRIFLPELLPSVDRVIYLDADAIVVDTLVPLWETDLGDALVGAVTNVFQADHAEHPARLGLTAAGSYFNTGVMLLDLAAMRSDGTSDRLCRYARANSEKLGFPEQDVMNVVVGARRLALHPRWNLMNSILLFASANDVFGADVVAEARATPAIRHFEGPGPNKPWHPLCEREGRELYLRHRRQTPWPRPRRRIVPARLARRPPP